VRIGIDVGGTNTDAVAIDGRRVVAATKVATTPDVTDGIVQALSEVLSGPAAAPERLQAVMIGTTHFTNALAEARRMAPTAAIRLSGEAPTLMPFVDWPARLRAEVEAATYVAPGGVEYDGAPIVAFDEGRVAALARELAERGIRCVAITAVFAPIDPTLERRARQIVESELGDSFVSVSHEIGTIGLLERENATILNASLRPLADELAAGLTAAIRAHGVDAPVFLSQNDGTLMSVERARLFPVATLASGPTNSMRGAAFLSGLGDCAVIDVGGTTSDIGMLRKGFPREAPGAVRLGGVRSNFRMPDVLSLPIGGGSVVRLGEGGRVGPESVGYRLRERALVFGGDVLTTTDLAVAAGRLELGDPSLAAGLPSAQVAAALDGIRDEIDTAVDRMKPDAGPLPVVLVGGGSALLEGTEIAGVEPVRPPHHSVANAIGAAIAQVGAGVDRIYSLARVDRDTALAEAAETAASLAVAAGADPGTVEIVEREDVQLTHLPSGVALRVRAKAVGDLRVDATGEQLHAVA
jgi:N-methylhydantoinase A/oxoprolinase/acetone carboxylase beta subunit